MNIEERFLAKVSPCPITGCWWWTGAVQAPGYGRFGIARQTFYAHRISYSLFVGTIPVGLEIDHLCRQPGCVNPRHLEPVTHRVNGLRGVGACAANARKTHCLRGHPLGPKRICLVCKYATAKARRARGAHGSPQ